MADLPIGRFEERVFLSAKTGVHGFVLYEVRLMRKLQKRWRCSFTWLTTTAVHVGVVPSVEADACLAAIKSIIAR